MPTALSNRPKVKEPVVRAIQATIGSLHAEHGGVLGENRATGVVDQYHFDATADRTGGTYSPCLPALEPVADAWIANRTRISGFVHSHPAGMIEPSRGDEVYARVLLDRNPRLPALLLPIVQSSRDVDRFAIHWYQAVRDPDHGVQIERINPIFIPDNRLDDDSEAADHPRIPRMLLPKDLLLDDGTFDRVQDAYDLNWLSLCRVVVIGVGGAAGFVEDLARAGIRDFALVDPDTVSVTNLATQHYRRSDIGQRKVDALKQRILDINPTATVVTLPSRLDDLGDPYLQGLVNRPIANYKRLPTSLARGDARIAAQIDVKIRPVCTLLCAMTDNFHAQARAARLALHLGVPYLAAQVYPQGMAAEIVFFHPDGPNTACPRCILDSRYRAFLEEGYQNDVGSAGTPLSTTAHLNAMKSHVAMALLHYGSGHPRWGSMLDTIGPNNLIQMRLHPDCDLAPFKRLTDAKPTTVRFGEPLFFPRKPLPDCPDCGGTGDLRRAKGRFSDTRILAPHEV